MARPTWIAYKACSSRKQALRRHIVLRKGRVGRPAVLTNVETFFFFFLGYPQADGVFDGQKEHQAGAEGPHKAAPIPIN